MNSKKMAVVTGGSRGIGRATVLRLAQEGLDVITCSRSEQKLAALRKDHEQLSTESRIYTFAADLSEQQGVESFVNHVKQQTQTIDLLINNAGGFIPGKISDEPDGNLQQMINLNLYSAYGVTRGLLPLILPQKEGHIMNMCSVASIVPYMHGGSYCIAKFALLGFSKVLREEMKEQGIRVTSILPGPALSDSWAEVELPEERFMPVEDVAACVWDAYNMSSRTVIEEIILRPQLGDI